MGCVSGPSYRQVFQLHLVLLVVGMFMGNLASKGILISCCVHNGCKHLACRTRRPKSLSPGIADIITVVYSQYEASPLLSTTRFMLITCEPGDKRLLA